MAELSPFWRRALVAAPLAAALAIAGATALFLRYLERVETEAAQAALIENSLAVEQSLRFQMDILASRLGQLAEGARDSEGFTAQAQVLRGIHPELLGLIRRDAEGQPSAVSPEGLPLFAPPVKIAGLARATGRPAVSEPLATDEGLAADLSAPAMDKDGAARGDVAARISLETLLARNAPWWAAARYRILLTDADGRVLAAKSHSEAPVEAISHRISLEPALRGIWLEMAPYRQPRGRAPIVFAATVSGLGLASAAAFGLAHGHMRRRRAAEKALLAEAGMRRAMEESLTVGLRARDMTGRILYVNRAFCEMVGFAAEEMVGRLPPMPYWDPAYLPETEALHNAVLRGEAPPEGFEALLRRSDGAPLHALIHEAPLIGPDGVQIGWMGSVLDVSERKNAAAREASEAERLQRVSRLVSMGEMASTLAHELSQPLAAIANYAAGCRALAGEESRLAPAIDKIGAEARRAGAILRRVRDLMKKREPHFAPCDLAQTLRDIAEFAEADARKAGARLVLTAEHEPPLTEADRILLEQALLNLIRNAVEAVAGQPPERRAIDLGLTYDGAEARFTVADRGPGVDPALAARLFEPFVSAKPEGLGMGLNICRSVAELHGGRVTQAARAEGGAVFTLAIPLRPSDPRDLDKGAAR